MQYCNYCQVSIKETEEKCPLCSNLLLDYDASKEIKKHFPIIRPYYKKRLAIRIMIFISIVAIVVSFSINMIFPSNINWPILFLFGLISTWLGLISVVLKRYNIPEKIMRQVVIMSILAIFWDWKIGWLGWSLDYVIPIICIAAMTIMYVTAKIMRLSTSDYITYSLIDAIFGIIPLLFILFDWVKIKYPSILSVTLSIIFLSAIFIFHGEDIWDEINRRMHI